MTGWSALVSLSGGVTGFVVGMVPLFAILGWWLWREPEVIEPDGEPVAGGAGPGAA